MNKNKILKISMPGRKQRLKKKDNGRESI